jgi:AraC-like DNA-binding protein
VIVDTLIASGDGFKVADVRCPGGHRHFDAPEEKHDHMLVAARRGAFFRRVQGRDVLVDGSVAYLSAPGSVEQFAHPVGGDVCTAIWLSPTLVGELAGGDPFISVPALPMDPASELALRRLTATAWRRDPAGELTEQVIRLVAGLLARHAPERVASGRPATTAAHRRLVRRAQAEMLADPAAGLIALGRRVGCSPHHLSRVFSRLTGSSVTAYRNRLRVSQALERIASGEPDLAALAAELGFADHAHMARTIRAATGQTPSACRALLASGGQSSAPIRRRSCGLSG